MRPIMPEQTLFAEVLVESVSETSVVLPRPLPNGAHSLRNKNPLDLLSAGDKQRSFKHLKYKRSRKNFSFESW